MPSKLEMNKALQATVEKYHRLAVERNGYAAACEGLTRKLAEAETRHAVEMADLTARLRKAQREIAGRGGPLRRAWRRIRMALRPNAAAGQLANEAATMTPEN